MEGHDVYFREKEPDEVKRLRDLIVVYEARLTAIAELAEYVQHGIEAEVIKVFGQIQLFLDDDLDANLQHRVKRMAVLTARIRDTVGLLREVHQLHNSTTMAG